MRIILSSQLFWKWFSVHAPILWHNISLELQHKKPQPNVIYHLFDFIIKLSSWPRWFQHSLTQNLSKNCNFCLSPFGTLFPTRSPSPGSSFFEFGLIVWKSAQISILAAPSGLKVTAQLGLDRFWPSTQKVTFIQIAKFALGYSCFVKIPQKM